MDNFDLKKYLAEGKLNKKQPIQEMDAPYDIIQSTLKNLAGYWPVDIKNNLDRLGAEEFKKRLDNLKPYIDQYFSKNIRIVLTGDEIWDVNFFEKHARFLDGPRVEDYLIIPHGENEIDCTPDNLKSCESYLKKNNIEYKIR